MKLAFCFAAELTEPKFTTSPSSIQLLEQRQRAFRSRRLEFIGSLDYEEFRRGDHQTYLLLGFVIDGLHRGGLETPRFRSILVSALQHTSQLPVPFAGHGTIDDTWEHWLHLASFSMASKSSFEEGEWCGYLSAGKELDGFRTRLENIRFQVDEGPVSNSIKGGGMVENRSFTLDGECRKENNRVILSLNCPGLHNYSCGWDSCYVCKWEAFMTPFGIVGCLERFRAYTSQPTGYLWIWKQAWMQSGSTAS